MGVFSLLLSACGENSESEPSMEQEEVVIHLDYSLMESGSMSRASEDVYSMFYDTYIKTKKITPRKYTLDFFSKKDTEKADQFIKEITGWWGSNDGVRLPVDTYYVKGTSVPVLSTPPGCACDSVWLSFDETIAISNETKTVTLNAKYDCFLLLFDAKNVSSIEAYYFDKVSEKRYLNSTNDVYYLFVTKTKRDMFDSASRLEVQITRKSGSIIRIDLSKLSLEKGKYYYFNDVTNTFDIEPMEQGS
ncbi:MAG: hypothetical protein HDQ88_09670 [Clostridia bacterium]|nr:hypothetical protein [Clostridia bacterium]